MPKKSDKSAEYRKAAYAREQNRVRGVIGRVRQHKQESPGDLADLFREDIRRVLVETRRKLADTDRESFLRWVASIRAAGVARTSDVIAFDPVRSFKKSRRMPFTAELEWVMARLQPHLMQLREFRSKAVILNDAFWSGDKDQTALTLKEIEDRFGKSLWSIELSLALAQHGDGLESQKAYLKKVKEEWKGGLPSYLAHFFSVRNEDRSTIRLFRDDARKRIEQAKLDEQAQTYLRFKIADSLQVAEADLSSILRTEQLQSIIDIYETAIEVIQRLIRASRHQKYIEVLAKCVEAWGCIDDFRIAKIAIALGLTPMQHIPLRPARGTYNLIEGTPSWAFFFSKRQHSKVPSDIWCGIENVLAAKIVGKSFQPAALSPWAELSDALDSTLERTDDFEAGSGTLEKFSRNFRGIYGAVALGDFVAYATGTTVSSQISVGAASLNTPSWGPEDLLLAKGQARTWLLGELAATGGGSLLKILDSNAPVSEGGLARGVILYLRALHLQHSKPEIALSNLKRIDAFAIPEVLRGFVVSLRIELALHEGERSQAIADIADEAARSNTIRNILPIEGAIEGREWQDLAATGNKLDLAIALDVMWRKTSKDLYGSFLRFAFEDFLAERSCTKPSQVSIPDNVDRAKVIYFLRNIAVPQVMDLTGFFNSSREVIEERSAVCETLRKGNPDHAATYAEEVDTIRRHLLIEDGLRLVDNSRINVDMPAVSRWAEQRYRESFGRYRALVEAGIGVADDFDEVVRQLNKHSTDGEFFNVPDNEADTLLLEMALSIKDQFLHNAEYGLEFFLGKRIRHGTVTGHLRGPLEAAKLITQRTSEDGDYRRNADWLSKLSFSSVECSTEVDKAFRSFARSYDDMTRRLKDESLHVRSKQHPKGVFDIVLNPIAYRLFRSVVKSDLRFEGFLDACYSVFWALLEPSLVTARGLLASESKHHAARLFDELHSRARENTVHDEVYHQLSLAIRNAAAEVQRQFDSMAEWLRRAETERAARRFELSEVVDIVVESASKTHSAYNPMVEREVHRQVLVPAALLTILYDIVFVIIGNACVRAGIMQQPEVFLSFHIDVEREVLRVVGVNAVSPSIDRQAIEEKLVRIRNRILVGDIQSGAAADKESGLLKIANITKQSKKSSLDFGFRSDGKFQTSVDLSIILDGEEGSMALMPATDNEITAG